MDSPPVLLSQVSAANKEFLRLQAIPNSARSASTVTGQQAVPPPVVDATTGRARSQLSGITSHHGETRCWIL